MLRHLSAACLAALLALIVVADRTSAKPPDLPDDDPIIVSTPEPTAAPVSQAVDGSFLFIIDLLPEFCREAEPERIATMPKVESECPYQPATADRRVLAEADLKDMPSVMDNLRALQKAAKEIDRAQKLGAAGKTAKAMKHLEKARKLCPGSSYARRVDEVMKELVGASQLQEALNNSEDLRQIELEWERIWFTDQPSHMTYDRVHGGIG